MTTGSSLTDFSALQPNFVYQNYNREDSAKLAEYSFLNIHGANAFTTDERAQRIRHGPRN